MKYKLVEMAFDWIKPIHDLPEGNLVKVVSKTLFTTVHPDHPVPKYRKRRFLEKELELAARSLIHKPVNINHMPGKCIEKAFVVDSEWNATERQVESLLYLPDWAIKEIKEGIFNKVSVDFGWRSEKETESGTIFEGLYFDEISLLTKDLPPGDPGTSISLLKESKSQKGRILMEMKKEKETLTEPFAGYKDFAACVTANKDKEDPDAYCASIQKKVEKPEEAQEDGRPDKAWWDRCIAKATKFADDPKKFCGWAWKEMPAMGEAEVKEQEEPVTSEVPAEVPAEKPIEKIKEEVAAIVEETVPEVVPEVDPRKVDAIATDVAEKTAEVVEEVAEEEPEVLPTVEEMQEALDKQANTLKELRESIDEKIATATKESKEKLAKELEAILPHGFFTRKNKKLKELDGYLRKMILELRK